MSALDTFKKMGRAAMGGARATQTAYNAAQQAREAFGGMANDTPNGGMMGNPWGGKINDWDSPENDHWDEYGTQQIEVDDSVRRNFRKKAEIKTDIIIGRIRASYLYKRIIAKLLITNKGDDKIALQHKELSEEEVRELPKEIQKLLRNQMHIAKIDSVKIDEDLRESCVEYFAFEFEENYRNGIANDFSGINPMQLLYQQYNQPFNELLGDLALDFGLENKEKGIAIAQAFIAKLMKNQPNSEEPIHDGTALTKKTEDFEEIEAESVSVQASTEGDLSQEIETEENE